MSRRRHGPKARRAGSLPGFVSSLSFRPPERIVLSAWYEHAPFAFWVVEQLRPNVFVELGTHYGFSFFAFCQAIRMAETSTAAYAVDRWTGDEHAGFYGEDVYRSVDAYCQDKYSDIATLMKMEFVDALQYFDDGSIDLLHIDGRHYLDDVTAEFDAWLPKLSNRAVILLHDTNVRHEGFGVHRFWSKVCNEYPNFSFNHGHGLGILGVGKRLPSALLNLFEASDDETLKVSIRNAYARLGGAVAKDAARNQLSAALEEQRKAAAHANAQATLLGGELDTLRAAVSKLNADLDAIRTTADETIRGRNDEIEQLSRDLDAARLFLRESQSEVQRIAGELDEARRNLERAKSEHWSISDALAASQVDLDRAAVEKKEIAATQAVCIRDLEARLTAESGERYRLATALTETEKQMGALRERAVDAETALARNGKQNGSRWTRLFGAGKRRDERQLMKGGLFDSDWYRREYPDVAASGRSPARHYLEEGYLYGYRPNPLFDTRWYLDRYDDVRHAGINPLLHYLDTGFREGRNPGPEFDTDFYLLSYPDVRSSGMNPLAHYLRHGKAEGRLAMRPRLGSVLR